MTTENVTIKWREKKVFSHVKWFFLTKLSSVVSKGPTKLIKLLYLLTFIIFYVVIFSLKKVIETYNINFVIFRFIIFFYRILLQHNYINSCHGRFSLFVNFFIPYQTLPLSLYLPIWMKNQIMINYISNCTNKYCRRNPLIPKWDVCKRILGYLMDVIYKI